MSDIPTIPADVRCLQNNTYFSSIPTAILNSSLDDSVVLGVDEAGRGPVLGPMVYAVAYCNRAYQDSVIKHHGFDDSKKLTDSSRRKLFRMIYTGQLDGIGYATTSITPAEISAGMLRFPPEKVYNLNDQAHDVTIALVDRVLNAGVKLDHVYVDTVGPPISYQDKLERRFPNCKFTVAKKADSLYPIVSVASIVAKVTRDTWLELLKDHPDQVLGSGYPSDQKTLTWLKENMTPLLGWDPALVRFSWRTCHTLLADSPDTIDIEWEEDSPNRGVKNLPPTFLKRNITSNVDAVVSLDAWYGC